MRQNSKRESTQDQTYSTFIAGEMMSSHKLCKSILAFTLTLVSFTSSMQIPMYAASDPPGQPPKESSDAKAAPSQGELITQMVTLIKQSRFAEAIPIATTLLEVVKKERGHDNEVTATVMHNLGFLYQQLGEYNKAEPIFLEALAIREKVLGPESTDVALSLNNLAQIYQDEGDYKHAEELYERAIRIKEKAYGLGRPEVVIEMNNLATLYKDAGELDKAEQTFKTVLPIFEKGYGAEDPKVATVLNNLASVYREKGDFAQATPLYERAIAIDKKANQLDYARDLNNMAVLAYEQNRSDDAAAAYAQALEIREKLLGNEHPDLVPLLNNIALLNLSRNDIDGAIKLQHHANDVSEHCLNMYLSSGSEDQKRLYLGTIADQIDSTISMNVKFAPDNKQATELALVTLLRRKGRVLDAVSHQLLTLRHHLSNEDQKLLDELSQTRSQLSQLVLRGTEKSQEAQYLDQVSTLRKNAEQLEGELSKHSAEFKVQNQPVSVADVQKAIPPRTALVEFAKYRSLNAKAKSQNDRFGPFRYAAYILRHDEAPLVVDLGVAGRIDSTAEQLRAALKDATSEKFKVPSRALDKLVMEPIRKRLDNQVHMLLLSPDGALNFIPFDALIKEDKKFLIEDYYIDYLTSGRDLLRMRTTEPSREGPVIIANPEFDQPVPHKGEKPKLYVPGNRTMGYAFPTVTPLPGTAYEANSISKILDGSRVFTGKNATEEELKRQAGPSILHIATHGFFIDADQSESVKDSRETRSIDIVPRVAVRKPDDPLLLSGLVLAGANNNQSGTKDDGILTALEVSGLDLWGTQLVVLSACDTGSGGLKSGEGVYGLRRAILLAGAETEVASLWPVSDEATALLMIEYYRLLMKSRGRVEALRSAQLQLLHSKRLSHPVYWAAFIPIGDWRRLRN
jgi:CHAT domain-containing protein/Tfp pilus assembly protein PilF